MNLPHRRILLPALLLLTAAAYMAGLPAPASYDDSTLGMILARSGSPRALLNTFLNPAPPAPLGVPLPPYAWRPLTEASFVVNAAITGETALWGLRLGNLAIHLAVVLLVWAVARRLVPQAALWAAAFVALHPMAVEAVTYVYQRSVALEAALMLLSVLLYLRGARAGALATGLLCMGAKEPAVTLPLVLAALEWVRRDPAEPLRKAFLRWLPFALLPAVVVVQVLRAAALMPTSADGRGMESFFRPAASPHNWHEYLLLELPVVVGYLRRTAWPFPLGFYHDRAFGPPVIPVMPTALYGALLLAALAWILCGPRRHSAARLGLALFLAPLALESGVIPIQDLAFNHRCYPGLLGAGLLFGLAAVRRPAAGALALALLAFATARENRVWADADALSGRDVRHAFHRPQIWGNHAWRRLEAGQADRAYRLFRSALRSPWQNPRNLAGKATALKALGRFEEARQAYDRVLKAYPDDPSTLWLAVRLAIERGEEGRLDALADRAAALTAPTPELALWTALRRSEAGGSGGEALAIVRRALAWYPAHRELLSLRRHLERAPVDARSGRF